MNDTYDEKRAAYSSWKRTYYAQFVNRAEAEEFRAICYFASSVKEQIDRNPHLEFMVLTDAWNAHCERG